MKYFCFRFDVDTHRCLNKGMPNLVKLGKELNVSFTFFINTGRAVSRMNYFRKILNKDSSNVTKLSNLERLGFYDFFIAAVFNPKVSNNSNIIKLAYDNDHEIGLHGGSNHSTWQVNGAKWDKGKIDREVNVGLKRLEKLGIKPVGFSSPDWQGSNSLHEILESLGFEYVADAHEKEDDEKLKPLSNLKLVDVPTNVINEKVGVGYVEHLRAKGMNSEEIIYNFKSKLENKKELAVVYDHPGYVGVKELDLVKRMIKVAKSNGFEITTLKNIVKKLK